MEAKELFRPLASLSVQAQVAPTLSVAALYFLEWQSFVYPEGATFLGGADFAFDGPDGLFQAVGGTPVFLKNDGASEPREVGDWGVALRWSPEGLDGTLGLYYRRYTDKVAAVLVSENPSGEGPMSPEVSSPSLYRQYYGEDVDLVGLGLAKQLLGASVGAEVSYRRHTPLLAQQLGLVAPPPSLPEEVLFPNGLPRLEGNSYQARGDTVHAVLRPPTTRRTCAPRGSAPGSGSAASAPSSGRSSPASSCLVSGRTRSCSGRRACRRRSRRSRCSP